MPQRLTRDLDRLLARIGSVADVLRWPDDRLYLRVESVSAWSPAQHLEHVFKSLDAFFDRVERLEAGHDPAIRSAGPCIWQARLLLVTGWIPRGRAEAPDAVLPDPRPVRARLLDARAIAAGKVAAIRTRANDLACVQGVLDHPLLGAFDVRQWVRFADVHTRHHLAIAKDVDRYRGIGEPAPETRRGDEPEYGVHAEAP